MISLIQISDLHIGENIRSIGNYHNRRTNRQGNARPHFRGHDERVAVDLTTDWEFMSGEREITALITGDLTRLGKGSEFGLGHRFVHNRWTVEPYRIGLGLGGAHPPPIPGNHDFWKSVVCSPLIRRDVLEPHFWELPWLIKVQDPDRQSAKWEAHFVGLDSCSGLMNFSYNQALAKGAVEQTQLDTAKVKFDAAQQQAAQAGRRSLRIVLVHHPPSSMEVAARKVFEKWLKDNHVSGILTGHTHERDHPGLLKQVGHPCHELRCGTTLQSGTYNQLPGKEANHYYLHGVIATPDGKTVQWTTKESWHSGVRWIPAIDVWSGLMPLI